MPAAVQATDHTAPGTPYALEEFSDWRPNMRTHLTHQSFSLTALIPLAVAISGCAVVEGVFKAGVWAGILSVLALATVIVVLVRMFAPR